jgi:hypothetical protein
MVWRAEWIQRSATPMHAAHNRHFPRLTLACLPSRIYSAAKKGQVLIPKSILLVAVVCPIFQVPAVIIF